MTDGDIERCRRHKHFSLGSVIFYLVLVAAYIAMINEMLIDQLMDATLSSIWLSFLLINAKLYDVSPSIIIVIYGFIGGFVAYRFGIFIPIVERTRLARAARARAAKEFRRSRPSWLPTNSIFLGSTRRAGNKILDYYGFWMDYFSDSKADAMRAREFNEAEIWGSMNRDGVTQGRVNRSGLSPKGSETLITAAGSPVVKPSFRYGRSFRTPQFDDFKDQVIPTFILEMRTTGSIFIENRDTHVQDKNLANVIFDCAEHEAVIDLHVETPILVIREKDNIGARAKVFRATQEVTNNSSTVLKRLLVRHVLSAERYQNGEELTSFEEAEALNSTFFLSELEDLLGFALNIFYPNDIILSTDERSEAIEHLHIWRRTALIRARRGKPTKVSENVDRISYADFSDWFLRLAARMITMHTPPDEIPECPSTPPEVIMIGNEGDTIIDVPDYFSVPARSQ